MAIYEHIEREFSADEPWGTKQLKHGDRTVRDIWEVETAQRSIRTARSREPFFRVLHWSYRSISRFRYLRHFAR